MMIVKFVEVYETTKTHTQDADRTYSLREVFINPGHVVCVRSDTGFKQRLQEGQLPEGVDDRQEFSRIYLNRGQVGLDIVVVGAPSLIEQKLRVLSTQSTKQKVLKG